MHAYNLLIKHMLSVSPQCLNWLPPFCLSRWVQAISGYSFGGDAGCGTCNVQAIVGKLHTDAWDSLDQTGVCDWHDRSVEIEEVAVGFEESLR